MAHRIEHQTGLILPNAPAPNNGNDAIAAPAANLSSAAIEALRSLRDGNPSLQRKMSHGIESNEISSVDQSLSYWNRHQEVVVVSANNDIVGVNFGGLMVRLVDVVPFFREVEGENLTLQTVNFGGTDIGMDNLLEGIKILSEDPKSSINGLYLGGCGIGCRKGTKDLVEALRLLPNLATLDLRYNDFEGRDLVDIAAFMSHAPSLRVLHLEGNMMKCDGAAAIGKMLANSNLKELYLGANQIGSDGARSLADGLANNGRLEKLYLEGNSIGDGGANSLRDVLLDQRGRRCKILDKLYVDNNGLTKEAATSLGRAVNSDSMIDGSLFDG